MAKYIARKCPKCRDDFWLVINQSPNSNGECPINAYCALCGYWLERWRLILGRKETIDSPRIGTIRDAMRTTKPTGATQLLLYISILTLLFSGAGVLTFASGSDKASAYLDRVEQKIMAGWKLPPQSNGLKVVLRMQLEKSGKISQVRVEKSSGNKTFDESAVAAVRKANPFPNVPEIAKMLLGDLRMVLEPGRSL
jgi:periplasmic protein TonB